MKTNSIEIFKSLFKGRKDVFALRWEAGEKSGYMPAYKFDWNAFAKHKSNGGTLNNFPDKTFLTLTDDRIVNHLLGKEIIGVYPLLENNTSWFIVADFDESTNNKTWIEACKLFIEVCRENKLPVYLERSRSGQGGHVWMFFEQPYPAHKSRIIFLQLLADCGIGTAIKKDSNFDRLFPNQDHHSGKGLGNLITLPLQQRALEKGNACFVDGDLVPYPDQWNFLNSIQKVSNNKLDELYNGINRSSSVTSIVNNNLANDELQIVLSNQVVISRAGMNLLLVRFLNDQLKFMNADYIIKKNTGRNTYGMQRYISSIEEGEQELLLPRGFIGKLLRFCNQKNIHYQFIDKRQKGETIIFNSSISLYDYQETAIPVTDKKDFGVVVAPPGSGKTLMALTIVARKQQSALIIVHRKQLFDQWIERIQSFLGIPKYRIGQIAGSKCDIGMDITIAMIQSLQSNDLPEKLYHSFGTIIVDECHHIPAVTFREVIKKFHTYYLYGFTATPKRKKKDESLIFAHIGEIIHEVIIPAGSVQGKQLNIVIRDTDFATPFQSATDRTEMLMNILIHDTARNELIVHDIQREVSAGRKVLVLTERKSHIEILSQYLKSKYEMIVLTGEDKDQMRKQKLKQVAENNFQILLATGQFIGEGADIDALNCLVLAYPFSFEGKLIQYIGRVQRSNVTPVIYDYKDYQVEYLDNLFKQRNRYYRKLSSSGHLKKFDELIIIFEADLCYIDQNEFAIECLDLPLAVESFNPDTVWKIRVLNYDEEAGDLFAEIIDYNWVNNNNKKQLSFYYYGIEKIRFRAIDTGKFLHSVVLKKQVIPENMPEKPKPISIIKKVVPIEQVEHVILKTMKVPFRNISFLHGSAGFPIYIQEIQQNVVFEIANPDIRPEFEAIKDYFIKAMKKKLIVVTISVHYNEHEIVFSKAESDDINDINASLIDSVRFEFVKKQILKPGSNNMGDNGIRTIDELVPKNVHGIFHSEKDLIDDILNIKKSKHYLQLKYLASKHESMILKLRFVLQPFSFIFLLSGEKKYHIIWETLDTEEASYIWHTDKTRASLKSTIERVEEAINIIKIRGRQEYLKLEHAGFTRILHDYTEAKKGFMTWKGQIEEMLV